MKTIGSFQAAADGQKACIATRDKVFAEMAIPVPTHPARPHLEGRVAAEFAAANDMAELMAEHSEK